MDIPYTICLCYYQDRVIMLHRTQPPHANMWNGLGGKIQHDETPFSCIQREMVEEAGINLRCVSSCFFAGIVTWGDHIPLKGMYVYIAHLSPQQAEQFQQAETHEGLIAWKPLTWVCDPQNTAVVNNIPRFLPLMLATQNSYEYFENVSEPSESDRRWTIRPLPHQIVLTECLPV